jgi:CHAT domain-containing protein/Tfp pilus assembly protein PilF
MYKFFLSILLFGALILCFSQNHQPSRSSLLKEYLVAGKTFQQADQLSIKAGDNEQLQGKADEIFKQSRIAFTKIIPAAIKEGYDSLVFFASLRAGYISFYLDEQLPAKQDYLAAIALKQKLPAIPDSFLFVHLIYTGGIYYNQGQYDSAVYFYKKAEEIKDKYTVTLNESQRLYNRLGVMYYETGNYRKARNYFEKAISVLSATDRANKALLANYRINIASLLVKLEELGEAKTVYRSVLPLFSNEVYHNLGIISIKEANYKQAIEYLYKVNYIGDKKYVDLCYNFGMAWASLGNHDSSEHYFKKALDENLKWNGQRKNVTYGLILKFRADQHARERRYMDAVKMYQQAIIQFDNNYSDTNIYKSPMHFSGLFSYINLFNTLVAKGDVLEKLYQFEKNITVLEASLDAYKSAFILAEYVEETYNSDDARQFLGKIKYSVHSDPIDICLTLYDLTRKKDYLEDAWLFDQRNKASVLSLNVIENEWKNSLKGEDKVLRREISLKSAITRLILKAAGLTDSVQLLQINTGIRDNEIELEKTREIIKNDPAWQQRNLAEIIPRVTDLQKKLDNTTALLSFHLSETELLTFIITNNQFEFHRAAINQDFYSEIESFRAALQNTPAGERYNGAISSMNLYRALILPLHDKIAHINRLVIIPDDELNYLPFEALQDENRKYLVEKYAVQYQYSAALLGYDDKERPAIQTLAFAPFAFTKYTDSAGHVLNSLPASIEEVNKLKGMVFTDSVATKANFLRAANQYPVIHLATHASVNNIDPARSFIAFYPSGNDFKLYAEEIYNLKLDSTQLIILSACETGTGQLVKGEGLMSLSRAFAYAGCPNVITSLWKAEDKTTAFITRRVHDYLDKGFTKDLALQHAKLDLLNSKETDPRFKTPDYWSNLIFIGNYTPNHYESKWQWVAIGVILVLLGYYFIKRKA